MRRFSLSFLSIACVAAVIVVPHTVLAKQRLLQLADIDAMRTVEDPRISPDGEWVLFTVATPAVKEDKQDRDIFMVRWDGEGEPIRMTTSKSEEHTPRWSPDGKWLAFLSDRNYEAETDQLWLLNRAGGEAERVTDLKGGVTDFAWSPDGQRLVLVVDDPKEEDKPGEDKPKDKKKIPQPIVIDRLQFKLDRVGYLGVQRNHLHLLDLATRKTEVLTPGRYNEHLPAWSPDGSMISFVTRRGDDFDRHRNFDIHVIDARPGSEARQLTQSKGADSDPDYESRPLWSPDGRSIAYLHGGKPELLWYAVARVGVIPSAGGEPHLPTATLDRATWKPRWSPDGKSLYFLLEDDGESYLARVRAWGGEIERLTLPGQVVTGISIGPEGRVAVLVATPERPAEVMALDNGKLRPLSRQNDALLADVRLGAMETIRFKSSDGAEIRGFVVTPPDYRAGRRYPAILRIHGGPVSQYDNSFRFDWQLFAANGYVVVATNPRGSSGRGEEFQRAIWADWGSVDVRDVLAGVDHVVERGLADPQRLGIGGWSYGGMLTNYTIARDSRFKAAVSGSSISNILAGYGTDHYIVEYELELGRPWENLDVWLRNSYPFLHADKIVTPTLFICGQNDVNVPLLASEQMYQALRSLEIDTQLIIYPGQYHGITRPSFLRDRLERNLAWYGRYLKPQPAAGAAAR